MWRCRLPRGSSSRLLYALNALVVTWLLFVLSPYEIHVVHKTAAIQDLEGAIGAAQQPHADGESLSVLRSDAEGPKSDRVDPGDGGKVNPVKRDGAPITRQREDPEEAEEYDEEDSDTDAEEEEDEDKLEVESVDPNYGSSSGGAQMNTLSNASRICTQQERLDHLRDYCRKHFRSRRRKTIRTLLLEPDSKVAYCSIAKVACTSWKSLLVYVRNYTNSSWPPVHNPRFLRDAGLQTPRKLSAQERARFPETYFSYVVVRHPFDRLVSAWRDKLVMPNSPMRKKLGPRIISAYRPANSSHTPSKDDNIALFHEFAEFLADKHVGNTHWRAYHRQCNPCGMQYNAIFRTETTESDAKTVMKHFPHYKGSVPFIHSHQASTSDIFLTQKHLPEFRHVSAKAMDYLFEKYGADMEMFGYGWDRTKQLAKCVVKTQDGHYCC